MTNWTDTELQEAYAATGDLIFMGRWREAVRLARVIFKRDPESWRSAINASGVLIDAADGLGRPKLLREAVTRIEAAMPNVPDHSLFVAHYNLGNGYLSLGQRQRGKGPATRPALSDAITHLDEALTLDSGPNVRTNLANALDAQGRVVEALGEYSRVIREHPDHGEARLNRAVALAFAARSIQPHKGLFGVALADALKARELFAGDPVRRAQCERVIRKYEKAAPHVPPTKTKPTKVAKWIWENGLNLNLCPYCAEETPEGYDLYALQGFHSDSSRPERIEQVHDMLNAIHRSFSTARWQALQGFGVSGRVPRDHVVIQRAAVDAHHDLRTGLLLTATSGFYSVLHQVAAATDSYFRRGHNPYGIDLARIWWPSGSKRKSIPRRRDELHPRFQRTRHVMLSALYRLAFSCERATGRYASLRDLRNNIEHHVVVVRDLEIQSPMYRSVETARLKDDVLNLGRIAKAALLYLGGAIWLEEYKRLQRPSKKPVVITHGTKWVDRT
jgi:hypothetical protein